MKRLLFSFLIVITSILIITAQESDFEIKLISRSFVPEETTNFEEAINAHFAVKSQKSTYKIIQFYAIPTNICLLYTSPSPRDLSTSRMPSSA